MFNRLFRKINETKEINELKKENKFLYELLTDDNISNYDLRLKISRMNLIYELQNVLQQKQKEIGKIYFSKKIDNLLDLEKKSKESVNMYVKYKNDIINQEIQNVQKRNKILIFENERLKEKIKNQHIEIEKKKKELIQLDDEILYQNFGLYTPVYNLMSSSLYKEQIKTCRKKQKEMVKQKTAAICHTNWTVCGSIREGKKMTNRNITQIIRSFNNECDYLISNVKYNNVYAIEKRIHNSFDTLNKLNEVNTIEISSKYLDLKIDELHLCHEHEEKKQEEKEHMRMIREEERERVKLLKEIEEERKKISKEQEHYNTYLKHINEQIEIEADLERLNFLFQKRNETEHTLIDLDTALKDIDYREANQKAGYVYIASNIGAFGENIFKIGMTRRLNPQDRIDELGGASVPFKFDVHAMIFSDNAPALEASLHKAFDNRKVNMKNNRKEFFNVTLDEIKQVVLENYDKTVDFVDIPSAQQYRETLKIKGNNTI